MAYLFATNPISKIQHHIIFFIFAIILCNAIKAMEQFSQPFIPSRDITTIIAEYVCNGETKKEFAQNLYAFSAISKFFLHYRKDSTFNGKIVQRLAKECEADVSQICPHDTIFAAAYYLGTAGAKEWMKTKYLTEAKNFKFISPTFFKLVNYSSKLKEFIRQIFPDQAPALIQRRLAGMIASDESQLIYVDSNLEFIKSLSNPDVQYNNELEQKLFNAIKQNKIEKIKKYLNAGADPDFECSGYSQLPLDIAINHKRSACISLLLEKGANPNNRAHKYFGPSYCALLHALLKKSSNKIINKLLHAGAYLNSFNMCGTPLYAAIEYNPECIPLLLKYGADPNLILIDKGSPLYCAIQKNSDIKYIRTLLEFGASPNKDKKCIPLHLVICLKNLPCFQLLLDYDANINAKSGPWTTLRLAKEFRFNSYENNEIYKLICQKIKEK